MKTYEQVDSYMQQIGLKYVKNTNDFLTGLAYRTDKDYTKKIAGELNARASGQNSSNSYFYQIKNENYEGSVFVSAAFDGGVFRHIGNMIIDNSALFKGEVLDLACDCGIVSCFIAKMYPDCHITGVDINQLAINNANTLAQKLGLTNISFVCADVFEYSADKKADTVTSFRGLLDVCMSKTAALPFFGERSRREKQYQSAFSNYAKAFADNINENGSVICVERYTADYGWMGWIDALAENGINALPEKCGIMRASDLSSVKEYSVTFARRGGEKHSSCEIINGVLIKNFKSGTGYEGYMAEFALYADSSEAVKFYDVFDKSSNKIVHQFAVSLSKSGKIISYDANAKRKKVKYYNQKKQSIVDKDIADKLAVYDKEKFEIKQYELKL